MAKEILFHGVRDEDGTLSLELCDTPVSYRMDKKFWKSIADLVEKTDFQRSIYKHKGEPLYRERVIEIVNSIRESLSSYK